MLRDDFNAVCGVGSQPNGKDEFVVFGFIAWLAPQSKPAVGVESCSGNRSPFQMETPRIHGSIEPDANFGDGIHSDCTASGRYLHHVRSFVGTMSPRPKSQGLALDLCRGA